MSLKGIKVLDLTRLLPGPLCTQFLTRLGANVVKVEVNNVKKNISDDYVRSIPPHVHFTDENGIHREHGVLFETLHCGKLGLGLDLRNSQSIDVMKRLVKHYDVVVEGNRPGTMDRLGIGFKDLVKENPKLVYCSLSGYGATGPYVNRAGHDINYLAMAGVLGLTGAEGSVPPTIGFQSADASSALHAALGILSAYIEAQRTGRGQLVDVSICESALALAVPALAVGLHAPGDGIERGNDMLNGGLSGYNVYETKDKQYIALGALEPHFWQRICEHLHRPDLETAAPESVRAFFLTKDRKDWIKLFETIDACIEPVISPEEVFQHPQHVSRQVVLRPPVGAPSDTPSQLVLGPRLSNHPPQRLQAAPLIGEHTTQLLKEAGFTEGEIEKLVMDGVVQLKAKGGETCPPPSPSSSSIPTRPPQHHPHHPPHTSPNSQRSHFSTSSRDFSVVAPQSPSLQPYRVAVKAGETYWWCACGRSKNQPFCDSSHKGTGISPVKFVAEKDSEKFPFCGCKLTNSAPKCDGSHKKKKPSTKPILTRPKEMEESLNAAITSALSTGIPLSSKKLKKAVLDILMQEYEDEEQLLSSFKPLFKPVLENCIATGVLELNGEDYQIAHAVEKKEKKKMKKVKKRDGDGQETAAEADDSAQAKKKKIKSEEKTEASDGILVVEPSNGPGTQDNEGKKPKKSKVGETSKEQKYPELWKTGEQMWRDNAFDHEYLSTNPDSITRLFCGNLKKDITEEQLKSCIDGITHIKWITDKQTGQFYGSTFLEVKDSKAAIEAVMKDRQKFMGRPLKIYYCPPRPGDVWPPRGVGNSSASNAAGASMKVSGPPRRERTPKPDGGRKLFMGNLAYTIDDDTIVEFFKDCGTLVGLRWLTRKDSGEFRGSGFVEFESSEQADKAILLDGQDLLGRPIRLDWTE